MTDYRTVLKKIIPKPLFILLQPYYHLGLAWYGNVRFGNPSKQLTVIAVTGTKGKSTTVELIEQIFRAHGTKVASLSTIQFSLNGKKQRNLFKMTMPGRFFVQKFLCDAVDAGCTHAIIEMTSEGARQYRHKFIALDALVFTNLSPEHIESHGSFEKYKQAKLQLADAVATSPKRPRVLVANGDDTYGTEFLNFPAEQKITYSLKDLTLYTLHKDSVSLVYHGSTIRVPIVGVFNVSNILAALKITEAYGVPTEIACRALENLETIAGRVEQFESPKTASKHIIAVVDYAHTVDSLEKLYQAFPDRPKVCVLGNTGGGRDTWKRPEMAAVAEQYCTQIILTNEDPYDEDPKKIIADMADGIQNKEKLTVIMDRREAIKKALELAPDGGYVLISGKGTDPYIMEANGKKTPWSDAEVVKELLTELQ